MYILIVCLGFSYGTCEEVLNIPHVTKFECQADQRAQLAKLTEVIYSVCAPAWQVRTPYSQEE